MSIDWQKSASDLAAIFDRARQGAATQAGMSAPSMTYSGMTDAQKGITTPAPNMPQAYSPSSNSGGSSPWQSYSPMGASTPPAMAQSYSAPPAPSTAQAMPQANLPSWMGNSYSQVPGTDWYSTNPSNQNAPKYRADGSPVATVGYNNQQTGQSYNGYATPEQFKQLLDGSNNAAGTSSLLSGMLSSGQLNMPQSSIYSPSGGYANMPAASQVSSNQGMPNAYAGSDMYGIPGLRTLPGDPNAKPQYQTLPGDPNAKPQFQLFSNTMGQGSSGQNAVAYAPANVKTDQLIPNAGGGSPVQLSSGGFIPQANNPYGAKTPAQIQAEAAAQIATQTAEKTRIANQTKTGYQTSYDRMNTATTDARNLENFKNSQLLNPFNGYSDYAQGEIARQRAITDRQNQQDLQTKIGNVDTQLQDYLNSTPAEQQKMINDMTDKERSYFLQTNAQALQSQQMAQTQSNADRTFNYNKGQDTITNNRNATNDAAANTGYYNPSGMNADQINQEIAKNSAAYSGATPEVQRQLHDRNLYLNSLLGKADSTGNGDYTGGNPGGNVGYRTVQGQTLDLNNAKDMATLTGYMSDGKGGYIKTSAKQQQDLSNAWLESEQLGYVTPNLSALTGIKSGTQTQTAKNQAAQIAISARNSDISATSTSNSNQNAKDRLAWDKDPNNPDNKLKESTITKNNSAASVVNPKTSTDNHALITKDIGGAKDAAEANALIEANRGVLTDADYKDLKKQVIDKF